MKVVHRWRWGDTLDRPGWGEVSLKESCCVFYEPEEAGIGLRPIYYTPGLYTHKQILRHQK